MAQMLINGERVILGALTVKRGINMNGENQEMFLGGQLATHRYFEEIKTIKTERMILRGVYVFEESFGSEDHEIIYTFSAASVDLIGGESHLTTDEIIALEKTMYKGEST